MSDKPMRAFRARELPAGTVAAAAEVGAIAPRLVAPREIAGDRCRARPSPTALRSAASRASRRAAPAASRRRARRRLQRRFEPAAIRDRIGPRHERDRMIGGAGQRARIDGPLPRLRERVNSATVTSRLRDEERRHIDAALACGRRPPLVVERHGIACAIGAHRERAGGDLDEVAGLGAWGLGLGLAPEQTTPQLPADEPKAAKLKSQAQAFINSPPSGTRSASHGGTRARYSSGSGISSRFGPPSRSSNRRSSGRGLARLGVDASSMLTQPGLEASFAGAREVGERAIGIRVDDAALDVMAAQLVAGPAGVVAAVRGFDAQQALRTPAAGSRRTPAPRTAASRRDACRRPRRSSSSTPKNTTHTAMCARLPRPSGPSSAQRDAASAAGRSTHEAIDRRHQRGSAAARTAACRRTSASPARRAASRDRTRRGRKRRRRSPAPAACAATSTDR